MADLRPWLERVDWPRTRVDGFRVAALRAHVAHAQARSRWHSDRLSAVDASSLDEADLASLPSMTKADLKEQFDAIVTDRRLTRERCLEALAAVDASASGGRIGEYAVSTSGGTTGDPCLVVFARREAELNGVAALRFIHRWAHRTGAWRGAPVVAVVTADAPRYRAQHVYRHLAARDTHVLSLASPPEQLVAELNRARPDLLQVYPSLLPRLAHAVLRRRLRIRPRLVVTGAEPLLPEHRRAVAASWGCAIIDGWGSAEVGVAAVGSGFDEGMLLLDDCVVVELVDRSGTPTAPGELADRVLVTPLARRTLPLIRYELGDRLASIEATASCGSSFRRVTHVQGRLEDRFFYAGGVEVDPLPIGRVLGEAQAVLEYQVRQTPRGVDARVTGARRLDTAPLARAIERVLQARGLRDPEVSLRQVPAIERSGPAAKLRRFVPLGAKDGESR